MSEEQKYSLEEIEKAYKEALEESFSLFHKRSDRCLLESFYEFFFIKKLKGVENFEVSSSET